MSTEKINAARGLLQELKGHGGGAAVAATGAGPAASAADMPALVGASERLVEAYIELAMVGVMALRLARFWLRLPVFASACIASVVRRVEGEEEGLLCRGRGRTN